MARLAHGIVAAAIAVAGCRRVEEPLAQGRLAVASDSAAALAPPPPSLPKATELLNVPGSPYQTTLYVDADAIELLTPSAAYRLAAGEEPRRIVLDLGFAATVTSHAYLYWSKGAVWRAERRSQGSKAPELVFRLAEQPQRLVANSAGTQIAWLEHLPGDTYAIAKRTGGGVKRLYTSSGSIDALTLRDDTLFFVERPSAAGWRMGRVPLATGKVTFSGEKAGRWPAMLAAASELVFYEGTRREVVALALDLEHERVLAEDFVCSPLAAASQVYCANLDGIFQLASGGPRPLVVGTRRPVTSLAADERRVVFVSDAGEPGEDRLSVSSISLDAPR